MAEPSEKTFLLRDTGTPDYVFGVGNSFERTFTLRKFQCCLCTILSSVFIAALLGAIVYLASLPSRDVTPTPPNSTLILLALKFPVDDNITAVSHDSIDVEDGINEGIKELSRKDAIEEKIPPLPIKSPGHRHQMAVSTTTRARNMSRMGYIEDHATKFLSRYYPILKFHKFHYNSTNPQMMQFCDNPTISCNPYHKYRSFNGTCNNLNHPNSYGVAFTPFRRALPPDYSDNINSPRTSKSGLKLPSARTVSLVVHRPYYRSDRKFTVILAVWGQFLDHDITATALSQKSDGSSISCCQTGTKTSPECFPVQLDPGDPFRVYNISCIEFVRSAAAPKCYLGPREQINQVSSYIDGSVIYSADQEKAKQLRTLQNGQLKMTTTKENRTLLPQSENPNDGCNREEQQKEGKYCFDTGDARANENLHLTSMHLIWARQHNNIALKLSKLNPHWTDEIIFHETRKIIAAQMQHITYNEFLPILFGRQLMSKFELAPKNRGFFEKYNASVDPSIANNFATAAFRFAHSIIPGLMKFLANDTESPEFIATHKMLFDPFKLYEPEELDRTLRGAMNTSIEATDSYFTNELKEHMFEQADEMKKNPRMCGLDLVSLNIQRGRDHGLPPYVQFRQHCGFKKPRNFDDLKYEFFEDNWHNVKAIYGSVEDIDLYTGALSEIPLNDSILGPTLTCLILDQFIRLKYGDRYWYENPTTPQTFTLPQLQELRKTSLAGIFCENSDNLETTTPRVMETTRRNNEITSCSKIDRPSWAVWREKLNQVSIATDFINVVKIGTN